MALLKEIELNNGVVVKYHRIVSVNKITNQSTTIEVGSYIDEQKRNDEMTGRVIGTYIETEYIDVDYDENSNITDYYNYLKTTEKYNGAEDV